MAEQRLVLCGSRQVPSLSEPLRCLPAGVASLLAFVLLRALPSFRSRPPAAPRALEIGCSLSQDCQSSPRYCGGTWDGDAGQLPPHGQPWVLRLEDE